jgi:hypothetical protein
LNSQFEVATLELKDLFSDFFIGEETAIDPSLALAHQPMERFNRINKGDSIGEVSKLISIFVDLHTQYSIFCKKDILIIE